MYCVYKNNAVMEGMLEKKKHITANLCHSALHCTHTKTVIILQTRIPLNKTVLRLFHMHKGMAFPKKNLLLLRQRCLMHEANYLHLYETHLHKLYHR